MIPIILHYHICNNSIYPYSIYTWNLGCFYERKDCQGQVPSGQETQVDPNNMKIKIFHDQVRAVESKDIGDGILVIVEKNNKNSTASTIDVELMQLKQ